MSLKIAQVLLTGAPLTDREKNVIFYLIKHHEKKVDEQIDIKGTTGSKTYLEKPNQNVDQLAVIIDADALAFFESTIEFFVLDRIKKQEKPETIWKRVMQNLQRLNKKLQSYAAQKIKQLPIECINGFPGNWQHELDTYMKTVPTSIENHKQTDGRHYATEEELRLMMKQINFQMMHFVSDGSFSSSTGSFTNYLDGIGLSSFGSIYQAQRADGEDPTSTQSGIAGDQEIETKEQRHIVPLTTISKSEAPKRRLVTKNTGSQPMKASLMSFSNKSNKDKQKITVGLVVVGAVLIASIIAMSIYMKKKKKLAESPKLCRSDNDIVNAIQII